MVLVEMALLPFTSTEVTSLLEDSAEAAGGKGPSSFAKEKDKTQNMNKAVKANVGLLCILIIIPELPR
jgi:hypothetical protein